MACGKAGLAKGQSSHAAGQGGAKVDTRKVGRYPARTREDRECGVPEDEDEGVKDREW